MTFVTDDTAQERSLDPELPCSETGTIGSTIGYSLVGMSLNEPPADCGVPIIGWKR